MKSGATIKASVVIVPFNQKDLVRKTLESLEAQTVPPKEFEVILVDESVDGTKASRTMTSSSNRTGSSRCFNPSKRTLRRSVSKA